MRVRWAALLLAMVSISARPAFAGDFGSVSLRALSGVTAHAETYESQLAIGISPALRLGRFFSMPRRLSDLRFSLGLSVQFELSGNDGRFRTTSYRSPETITSGPQSIALDDVGRVVGVSAGQVDGTSRRALLSDLSLGLAHDALYTVKKLRLDIGANLNFSFPTSVSSRVSGLIFALSAGVSFSRQFFGRLDLSYSASYQQYAYRYSTSTVETLGGEVMINGRLEPVFQPKRATILNPAFGVTNEFAASVKILPWLSASATYSLSNTFTASLDDVKLADQPLAQPCIQPGGAAVPCGDRAQRDWHSLTVEVVAKAAKGLKVVLALNTAQPLRHEGRSISNPFFQTLASANYTTLQLALKADIETSAQALRRASRRLFGK